jgi:small subunit ribosomal protein S17
MIERKYSHPVLKKVIKVRKNYNVHDENNTFKKGDVVELLATRPLSKLKRWRTSKLIKNGNK